MINWDLLAKRKGHRHHLFTSRCHSTEVEGDHLCNEAGSMYNSQPLDLKKNDEEDDVEVVEGSFQIANQVMQ